MQDKETNMNGKEKYLNNLKNQIEDERNRNQSVIERLKIASNREEFKQLLAEVSFVRDPEVIQKMYEIARNPLEDTASRLTALQKLVLTQANNPDFVTLCLQVVTADKNVETLRIRALMLLNSLSFSSKSFFVLKPELLPTFRNLLDDQSPMIRQMSAEFLSTEKDEYVQRRLLADLNAGQENIVSRAKAIQFLAYDLHGEHYPIVRKILQENISSEVEKIEAIHVLANDPSSKELLKDLLQDKSQNKEIRLSSASALQVSNPQEFIALAKKLILDNRELKDVRVLLLNGLLQHTESTELKNDSQFFNNVVKLGKLAVSTELKKASKNLIDRADKKKNDKEQNQRTSNK